MAKQKRDVKQLRERMISELRSRATDELKGKRSTREFAAVDPEQYFDTVITALYSYTRPRKGKKGVSLLMVEVVTALGHAVRRKLRQPTNSAVAARIGAFVLYTWEAHGILQVRLGAGHGKHQAYLVDVLDEDVLCDMWDALNIEKIDKMPNLSVPEPWVTPRQRDGMPILKTFDPTLLARISIDKQPLLFECLNRAQAVGWRVNEDVLEHVDWALKHKTDAFADIWEQHNPEAKETKLREARAVWRIASKLKGRLFYHRYYYDFRGRKYPASAYLHEQGADLARGLLIRETGAAIGVKGLSWLLIAAANAWAGPVVEGQAADALKTDKIALKDRIRWGRDNVQWMMAIARNPRLNQKWMKADKPWQFLALCIELNKVFTCAEPTAFVSHLEVFIDGSNNGTQHLSALTRDEVTAPHVNLVPSELPGDLYRYVAEHVWTQLFKLREQLTPAQIETGEQFLDELIAIKRAITAAEPKSEERAKLIERIMAFKAARKEDYDNSPVLFWCRITDTKERRKIVKRNVMTLPYGGTPYGLGQQQIDDSRRHGIDSLLYLEHKWGAFLGRIVYDNCRLSMPRSMALLGIFEEAGKKAEADGRFLEWTAPVTGLPVVQAYSEGRVKKIFVAYGPQGLMTTPGHYSNELQLHICFIEDTVPSKGKQAAGASPNAIHSLDAVHLVMTVCDCDFVVTTVHDAYGCLAADMPMLYRKVRENFIKLYKENPLMQLMSDIGGDASGLTLGTLDVTKVMDCAFCFC